MSLLRSNELRVLLKQDGDLEDISSLVRSFSGDGKELNWTTAGTALFIGFRHKFNHRYFKTGKSGAAVGAEPTDEDPDGTAPSGAEPGLMAVKYWDGKEFKAFKDVTDETEGLTKSGFVVWEDRPEWQRSVVDKISDLSDYPNKEVELFWVKIELDSDFDSVTLQAVKFLLSDERAMTQVFPEIYEYLPRGKTDFMEQHEAAKDAITTLLRVKGILDYQEQIKNPDDWMMAATYRAIDIILSPIAGDDRLLEVKRDIAAKAAQYTNISKAALDKNKNEDLDAHEDPESASPSAGSLTSWMSR